MNREYLGRSVVDGRVRFLSVSSVEKFDPNTFGGCPAKWHIRYIRGVKDKPTKGKDFGDAVHAQLKHLLLTGQNGVHQRMQPMLKYVPAPGPGLFVEHQLSPAISKPEDIESGVWRKDPRTLVYADIPFTGALDVRNERGEHINENGDIVRDGLIEVIDWKSSKSIADYAKTEEELKRSVQMSGYADSITRWYPNVERVRLSHVYGQTQGAECAKKVTTTIDLTEIIDRRNYHDAIAREMVDVAREPETKNVPYNLDSCTAFRACPYQGICPHFGGGTAKGKIMSGLLSRIKAKQTETTPTVTPPPAPGTSIVSGMNLQVGSTLSTGEVVKAQLPEGKYVVDTRTDPVVATKVDPDPGVEREPEPQEPTKRKRKEKAPEVVAFKVKEITLTQSVTANLGDYSSAKVELRLTADGDETHIEKLGEIIRAKLEKQLEEYTK